MRIYGSRVQGFLCKIVELFGLGVGKREPSFKGAVKPDLKSSIPEQSCEVAALLMHGLGVRVTVGLRRSRGFVFVFLGPLHIFGGCRHRGSLWGNINKNPTHAPDACYHCFYCGGRVSAFYSPKL